MLVLVFIYFNDMKYKYTNSTHFIVMLMYKWYTHGIEKVAAAHVFTVTPAL